MDLRFALRSFARRPGFTAVAALTLALGIGATTAVFSIVSAVLLRPLPYKDPDRLVAVWITSLREKSLAKLFATHRDYEEFRRHSQSLESVAAATWATRTGRVLTGSGPARAMMTIPATAGFFDTLGVRAELGRTFRSDDEPRGCSVVLAHNYWVSSFGADKTIPGRTITLDQAPCTVLGVMPERFVFYPPVTQAWILLGANFQPDQDHMFVGIFARLKPGVSREHAQAELRSLFRSIHKDAETASFQPVVFDLHGEFTFLAGRLLRATLLTVFAAVLLVLLIACLNVANLLTARLSERHRELAVRAALGAAQGRMVRQLFTENLLLGVTGAALGVAIAAAALQYFRAASPIELTAGADVSLNLPVLLFSAGVGLATTLIFGLFPALQASRFDLAERLRSAGRGAIRGRQRLSRALIAVEMAVSFLLLTGAGLLIGSALHMYDAPLGFQPDGVLVATLDLPPSRYADTKARQRLYDQLLDRLPGAALASRVPPDWGGTQTLQVAQHPVPEGTAPHDVGAETVSPGYFGLLRIPLRSGRMFDARDRETAQAVAIVNEALVKEYFPDSNPLGAQVRINGARGPWLTIVGVVGNQKHGELMNEMSWVETPGIYRPVAQDPRATLSVVTRGAGPQEMRAQIAALDPGIPVGRVESLQTRLSLLLAYPRFRATVLGAFALGALLLAAVGLNGVLSQLVAQRIPEFGVRRAVGAQTANLLWLVARQGGLPVIAGLLIGIGCTLAFSRILATLLYGIQPSDPETMVLVSLLLLLVAAFAMVLPARRAAQVDPMVALREE